MTSSAPPHGAAPLPPSLRERFRPRRLLGRGGMGAVFEVEDRDLDRAVAMKVILEGASEKDRLRFLREARALARLDHPNVLPVLDFGTSDEGVPYLLTPVFEGGTLLDHLRDLRAHRWLNQAAGGLEAMHAAGVLHRDIKPANIGLLTDDRAVVADLGLATWDEATNLTATGHVVGTVPFLAPEVLLGNPYTPAADWYAWGVSLYLLVEQRYPFEVPEILRAVASGQRPPLHLQALEPDDPRRPLIDALLRWDPAERAGFPELAACQGGQPGTESWPAVERPTAAPVATRGDGAPSPSGGAGFEREDLPTVALATAADASGPGGPAQSTPRGEGEAGPGGPTRRRPWIGLGLVAAVAVLAARAWRAPDPGQAPPPPAGAPGAPQPARPDRLAALTRAARPLEENLAASRGAAGPWMSFLLGGPPAPAQARRILDPGSLQAGLRAVRVLQQVLLDHRRGGQDALGPDEVPRLARLLQGVFFPFLYERSQFQGGNTLVTLVDPSRSIFRGVDAGAVEDFLQGVRVLREAAAEVATDLEQVPAPRPPLVVAVQATLAAAVRRPLLVPDLGSRREPDEAVALGARLAAAHEAARGDRPVEAWLVWASLVVWRELTFFPEDLCALARQVGPDLDLRIAALDRSPDEVTRARAAHVCVRAFELAECPSDDGPARVRELAREVRSLAEDPRALQVARPLLAGSADAPETAFRAPGEVGDLGPLLEALGEVGAVEPERAPGR